MPQQAKDLFDDSTMTFGEHLEILRVHLFKAILGLVVAVCITLYYGTSIVAFIRKPIDNALVRWGNKVEVTDDMAGSEKQDWWAYFKDQIGADVWTGEPEKPTTTGPATPTRIDVTVSAKALVAALHEALPAQIPAPTPTLEDRRITLPLVAEEFSQLRTVVKQSQQAVTLNVQEAFMTYMKVSFIAALVLASPWICWQIWQFVAAGLYRHERRFVYVYGGMSLGLFLTGVVFCFYLVFPFVLRFLLGFNNAIGVTAQVRLSEWISFATVLPLMFGISFQLPLAMRFLQAISIFTVDNYREKRRISILVIAFISMVLTPADPMSMMLMLIPLVALYELGIWLCQMSSATSPFGDDETALATRS